QHGLFAVRAAGQPGRSALVVVRATHVAARGGFLLLRDGHGVDSKPALGQASGERDYGRKAKERKPFFRDPLSPICESTHITSCEITLRSTRPAVSLRRLRRRPTCEGRLVAAPLRGSDRRGPRRHPSTEPRTRDNSPIRARAD